MDYSPQNAFRLAEIESKLGVRTTYLILLHEETYNPLERRTRGIFEKIGEMGHVIGIHFDSHYYSHLNSKNFKNKIIAEFSILQKSFSFKFPYKIFSFHNTIVLFGLLTSFFYQIGIFSC